MKHRYVFPAYARVPGLDPYCVLEARIGSMRLLVPSSGPYGFQLLVIFGISLGYLGAFDLIASSPFYQKAAPWRIPGFSIGIVLAMVVGFFALLVWEERNVYNWTIRLTSRHPRRFKQIQPLTLRPSRFFQELVAVIDDDEVLLRIEASYRKVFSAFNLSRIPVTRSESRTTVSLPRGDQRRSPLGFLFGWFSQTSFNIGGVAILLFIGSLFSLYVWFLIYDPLNWVWILATLLFGWLLAVIIRVVVKSRRFYCYKCDGYEVFLRKRGEWQCHSCGEATAC
jgi:hypothetical protein